jgi:CheY-like chemotaxis protein
MTKPEEQTVEYHPLESIRVLIADDESNIRALLSDFIKSLGMTDVRTAEDGKQAIKILLEHKVDILLLDLQMPGLDGYQVARKAVQLWPDLVIVVVTANATIGAAVDLMKIGVFDVIEKPFQYETFKAKILKAVGEFNRRSEVRSERGKRKNFGKYLIEKELSRGGMGIVYKARDTDKDIPVALKVLASHFKKQEQVARFYLEGDTITHLHHPGVVSIYEMGIVEGQHFLSMEYIEGKSLYDLIYANELTYTEGIFLLANLLEAVDYIHAAGILHRDLKPSNVLLDEARNPHLIDFGLAKSIKSAIKITQTDLILGTFGYLAPERLSGGVVDQQSDVFSVGAILYEMITHRLPYEKEDQTNVFPDFTVAAVPPSSCNPKIPPYIEKVCLKAIAVEKKERYDTASEFKEALEVFLDQQRQESL